MRKQDLSKAFVAFMVMFLMASLSMMAGGSNSDYYATAKAIAKGATGAGKVYASTSTTSSPAYDYESTSDRQTSSAKEAPTYKFQLYAQAQGDGIFKGWYDSEACNGKTLSTAEHYEASVGGNTESDYVKNYYALFVYHYYATVNATAVGDGGSVSVNSGAAGVNASATMESGDETGDGATLSFTLSAQATDSDHFFVGWYSDPACTDLVSDQAECSVTLPTSATNSASAPSANYYAKFEEIVRSDYTFTLTANPAHFASITGGAEGNLSDLGYSAAGVANTSDAAPFFHLQVNPSGDIIYSVKVYNGGNLVETYATEATEAATFSIPNTVLDGTNIVIESRQGWFLTVKGNPAVTTSITGAGQALNYSAEGVRNELTATGDYEVRITPADDQVCSTLRFYNAAGEMISMPFQNVKGAQSATIDCGQIKGGRVEVTGLVLGDDMPYLILKANPAHFTSIKGGVGTNSSSANYNIDLSYSEQGEIVVYPELGSGESFYYQITPAADVEYSITYHYTNGKAPYSAYNNRTSSTTSNFPKSADINRGVVEISSVELMPEGADWSYTIKADPELLNLKDYANGGVAVECSLDGYEYHPQGQFSQIQMQGKVANKMYNAYFFKAGADINDVDQAFMTYENINVKNLNSWYSPMQKKISNTNGNGGTLVIRNLEGVGTGNVTINISGNASNIVVTNGSSEVTGLKVGANTVALTAAILSFTHKTNGKHIASIKCNGVDMTEADSEGKYSYTNKLAADGDVYDIVTDYSNTEYDVNIEVPAGCESFVTEVTVDGTKVTWTPGQALRVAEGKTVRVQGDKFGYIVNAIEVNGEPQLVNNSVSKLVLGDTRIAFDVTKIVRDKSLTFQIGDNAKGDLRTALGSFMEVTSTSQVEFGDDDNPINFGGTCTSSAEKEWVGRWYVNGEVRGTGVSFVYEAAHGDVIKVEFVDGDKIETTYNVTFSRSEGLEAWPSVTVDGVEKTPGNMAVAANTEIVIRSNEYVNVTSVKVSGRTQTPEADGSYVITITEDTRIEIIGEAVASAPTFTLNITGPVEKLYVADGENEYISDLHEGENVIDMTSIAEGPIVITNIFTDSDYYVSAISLNGTSIYGDDAYYIPYLNGAYMIDVQANDRIDVTISTLRRDKTLNVYIDGMAGITGCSISDKNNNASLVENEDGTLGNTLKEGLNVIRFSDGDLPLNFQCYGLSDPSTSLSIVLDNEPVELVEEVGYLINCVDGQSLYVSVVESQSYEPVHIDSVGRTTYTSHNDLTFDDSDDAEVRAYIAIGYDKDSNAVKFARVTGTIPAGTGLMILSTYVNDVKIPIASKGRAKAPMMHAEDDGETPVTLEDNLLMPAYKYATIPAADEANDCYAYGNIDGVDGFHLVTSPISADSDQAYLVLPKDTERPDNIENFYNVTSGNPITGVEDICVDSTPSQAVYNIHGIKVADNIDEKTLPAGFYIVGGKKILVK